MQKIIRKMVNGGDVIDFSPEELLSCFKVFDLDGDGNISTDDLHHVLTTIGNLRMSEQDVHKILTRFDSDNNGIIDYAEFAMGLLEENPIERDSMKKEAIQQMQRDGDGNGNGNGECEG